MNKLFWSQSTKSGLGDRLLDLSLMSAWALCLKVELNLNWEFVCPGPKPWNEIRYHDYLYENFSQYFNLPENVFVNKGISPSSCQIFSYYLGGIYSPQSFFLKFIMPLTPFIDWRTYQQAFFETTKKFTPKNKLIDLLINQEPPTLSIHIRRGDKIREKIDEGKDSILPQDLISLNNLTQQVVDKLKNNNSKIFICSDDETEKLNYFSLYKDNLYLAPNNLGYLQTYVDLYLLSVSDTIIISQKHSSFSLFASIINRKQLVYLFEDGLIASHFKDLDNLKYYKHLDTLC